MLVNNNEGKRTQKIIRLEVSQNPSPKEKRFFSIKPSPIKMKIARTAVTINEFWRCESGRQGETIYLPVGKEKRRELRKLW